MSNVESKHDTCIYMTADRNAAADPDAARVLKTSTYVDDIVYSVPDKDKALKSPPVQTRIIGLRIYWDPIGDTLVTKIKLNF